MNGKDTLISGLIIILNEVKLMNNYMECYEVFREIWDKAKEIWQSIQEAITTSQLDISGRNDIRRTWRPMIDNTKKSQVMNRKPIVSNIRNAI